MNVYQYSTDYNDKTLAALYDRSQTYNDDVELIRRLLDGRGPLRIVEWFCGTGRILVPLAQDGHHITGLDIAPAMLDRAAAKLGR